ncbi:ABC transporter substrate-binding protein [Peptoniphilus stercorisuis]|uniref:Spermidine/putrescine transport system substrate-binding protein n=1 Tax=Peptoniphilus stercorisuis TaxID=1436965 RepID=A0ABS4KBH3_9FIRM|nr:spermidine/putrescine ABC transporter substrate-binding protein [Peptoniphilus stercorisuis]MBP2025138.1 spermidine/putrescine transport system substrate-binding protein [Peptoniphilus stercorisuis]
MKKKISLLIILVILLFTTSFLSSCKKTDSANSINVYNWGEYIDPETIKLFEEETGIKVNYETYASNEDLYVKLVQNSDSYDIVVPSDYMIERLIKEGLVQKIDFNNIPNFAGVEENIKNPGFDPTNEYSVPYFWGTLGIVYNDSMIKNEITSWSDLWNEKYKNQIIMYNSQRDSIAIALRKLGYSMNSVDINELQSAKKELIKQKPLVYAYLTDDGRDVLVQADAAMGVMYSGDALLMMSENKNLKYVVPKEGSNIWYDSFVIPNSAKNKKGAEEFINFMSRPDIAAINAEYCVGYTSPVVKAKDLLPDEIRNSYVAYPNMEDLPNLEVYRDLDKMVAVYDRIWTEVIATMK